MATEEMMVIGIAGGTGSGKTTLTNRLKERFGDEVTVIYHDNYYKRHDELTYEERCLLNYDHPDAFDTDLMMEHIRDLRAGKSIQCPVYDFTVHNRSDKTVEIHPTKVLIIEGILIFENKELRDLMDIKVFVDTDADVRILRRILRDVKERGRSLESVVDQYLQTVKPMHEQFVEPSKRGGRYYRAGRRTECGGAGYDDSADLQPCLWHPCEIRSRSMDWKGNLQKSVIWGIFFSAAVQIIADRGHVNILKFIAFALLFAVLYFLWLTLTGNRK